MSVIEEEKELTEIAGDFSMENSTSNILKQKFPMEITVEMNDTTHVHTDSHNQILSSQGAERPSIFNNSPQNFMNKTIHPVQ
jgi:hypothetical protein